MVNYVWYVGFNTQLPGPPRPTHGCGECQADFYRLKCPDKSRCMKHIILVFLIKIGCHRRENFEHEI